MLFTADYTDMENLVTWLMTFGAKAEVLEPAEARDIIRRNAEETLKIYGGNPGAGEPAILQSRKEI